ncbi:MAG: hypothetical protein M3O31_18330 [Acidobacteriota bacterium]|nr:hypothetical protein [Acidobacteriota bacterium]
MPVNRSSYFNSTWIALAISSLVLLSTLAVAKSDKPILPGYILNARTVTVMIDPAAGISVSDPNANQTAQRDVETALLKWGRFTTVIGPEDADLIIVLRKGHGRIADATISDPRQNSRVGSVTRTDDGIAIGAQHGVPPPGASSTNGVPAPPRQDGSSTANPQAEIGNTEDAFLVFEGKKEYGASDIPGWRWIRRNGLHAHDVPAVDEFRKAIAEAEKQAAQQPGKHP